jgi:mycothiol synthase
MIEFKGAPKIEGLVLRRFKDKSDYSILSAIGKRSWEADGIENIETEEEISSEYVDQPDQDPSSEVFIAEIMGEPVGYGRFSHEPDNEGELVFWHIVHVVPEWRGTSLRLALLRFIEAQASNAARNRHWPGKTSFGTWAMDNPNDWRDMLLAEGYEPTMHFFEMVRHTLEAVPDYELPDGLELRPAIPEHYPQIWSARKESLREKPFFVESRYDKKHYDQWLNWPTFTPDMWLVAWEGDSVVGMAENHVPLENEAFGLKRGHTQILFVLPRWRRRGLAKALLSKSLVMMREMGLEEAVLDVETQNTSGEIQLYESMGYVVDRNFAQYKKRIDL